MDIDIDDLPALLDQVDQFALKQLVPSTLPFETPLSQDKRLALTEEAQQLGLLPSHTERSGLGLWENTNSTLANRFNFHLLTQFAHADTGLAFAWHRQAIAINTALAVTDKLDSCVALLTTGHFGLGREALGAYLSNQPHGADHKAALADWLNPKTPRVLIAPMEWQQLVMPLWDGDQIVWWLINRDKLTINQRHQQHGLDTLQAFSVALSGDIDGVMLGQGAQFTAQLIKQDLLGLLAISYGSLQRLNALTHEYTSLRRQGGTVINRHPAVIALHADIDTALTQTQLALAAFEQPLNDIALTQVLLMRAHLHPLLCLGASQAMQAHGGTGYMQDVGIEKGLRAQNTLRMLSGGLVEVPLMINGLRGAA